MVFWLWNTLRQKYCFDFRTQFGSSILVVGMEDKPNIFQIAYVRTTIHLPAFISDFQTLGEGENQIAVCFFWNLAKFPRLNFSIVTGALFFCRYVFFEKLFQCSHENFERSREDCQKLSLPLEKNPV